VVVGAVLGLSGPIVSLAGGAPLAAFVGLVILHRAALRRTERYRQLSRENEAALHRASRFWEALVGNGETTPPQHPYADDLDVFGQGSLSALFAWPSTPAGRQTLRDWLLYPADPSTVRERQEAVAELAPLVDFRDDLIVEGRATRPASAQATARFLSWCEGSPWLRGHTWWWLAAWLLPLATLLLVMLQAAGIVAPPYWAITAGLTILVAWYVRRAAGPIVEAATSGEGVTSGSIGLLAVIASRRFHAPGLVRLQAALQVDGRAAHAEMRRLQRVFVCAEVRFSDLLHLVLRFTILWDVHVLAAVERWRARSGPHVRRWIAAVGEIEALAALSGLRHAHPEWVFPRILATDGYGIDAGDLGHPLLPVDRCVTNDVRIARAAPLFVVTGSNMSGKSTLLRALGVNVVLANAGAPVCASRFDIGRLALFTSMRVRDSLTQGVSQFLAELQRLKQAVDGAAAASAAGVAVLFLLDDILYGTTALERRKAVEIVLGRLMEHGAMGAIAGHDLPIDERTPFWPKARVVHLRERVRADGAGVGLSFDYKLRPGRASGGTAIELLAQLGLE